MGGGSSNRQTDACPGWNWPKLKYKALKSPGQPCWLTGTLWIVRSGDLTRSSNHIVDGRGEVPWCTLMRRNVTPANKPASDKCPRSRTLVIHSLGQTAAVETNTWDMQTIHSSFHSLSQLRAAKCSATPKPKRGWNLPKKMVVVGQRRQRHLLLRRTLTQINQIKPNPSYFNLTVTDPVTKTTKS